MWLELRPCGFPTSPRSSRRGPSPRSTWWISAPRCWARELGRPPEPLATWHRSLSATASHPSPTCTLDVWHSVACVFGAWWFFGVDKLLRFWQFRWTPTVGSWILGSICVSSSRSSRNSLVIIPTSNYSWTMLNMEMSNMTMNFNDQPEQVAGPKAMPRPSKFPSKLHLIL